jgi:hypothetical protein
MLTNRIYSIVQRVGKKAVASDQYKKIHMEEDFAEDN